MTAAQSFFSSFNIYLRDKSGEQIPFLSVGIRWPYSMFSKTCNSHMSAGVLEITALEIATIVNGRKKLKKAAKNVRRQFLSKPWRSGNTESLHAKPFQQNLKWIAKLFNRSPVDKFFKLFSIIKSNSIFPKQLFITVCRNVEGRSQKLSMFCRQTENFIPLPHWWTKNCLDFQIQTTRNYYDDLTQTFYALKIKIVRIT